MRINNNFETIPVNLIDYINQFEVSIKTIELIMEFENIPN